MENRNGHKGLGRRQILKNAGAVTATAALVSAVRASFPGGAFAQAAGPETNKVTLGFIALTDASPLIIAKEKKLFDKYGITEANVAKQASWGTTRDNLVLGGGSGGIDGAHILTPKPYQISLGTTTPENRPVPMYILARLNYDCQGLSVSNEFKGLGATIDAKPLKEAFAKKKAAGKEVKCAMTFPGGTHDLWIRYWLAAAGIDPDKDVSTIVVPPAQMVANMKVGNMDAFCVGEPWNEQLVNQDIGFTAAMTGELWMNHPEKSLGMRADWVDKNPKAAMAVLMAVLEAQQWCDKMENKQELANIIGKRQWFNVPPADIINRIKGEFNYGDGRKVSNSNQLMKFWKGGVSYPYQSHELWFLTENQRWGKLPMDLDTKAIIAKVNREDLWRTAAKNIGAAESDVPKTTSRGKETFFDGKVFDPEDPKGYLASLQIKKVA
ncbi:CmpA/NrtA family ABC transporter substrate-binding protein [uncultured Reyranella sp.]|uniref:CmpA/NrtA family ABC transporter substrate-binding protein n=1 Tax=uncultured Reyranella sp. TaxID=735512 RepID=UPI0025D0ECB6|nr:CmpA/NrtA family ABC transporter substrate-binding protein [uncultured Reyranella sp.]